MKRDNVLKLIESQPDWSPDQIGEAANCTGTYVRIILRRLGCHPSGKVRVPKRSLTIDPIWAAEFRGLIGGEGCLTFSDHHNMLTPSLIICLRDDDRALLENVKATLGGTIRPVKATRIRKYKGNPQLRWRISGWARIKEIIEATGLLDCRLPFLKSKQVPIFYNCILARLGMPLRPSPVQREELQAYRRALSNAKRYRL